MEGQNNRIEEMASGVRLFDVGINKRHKFAIVDWLVA